MAMSNGGKRGPVGEAWRIAKPYWVSEHKWAALGLLAIIVGLTLGRVGLDVAFNYWYNAFYNALQDFDASSFYFLCIVFAGLATLWVAVLTSLDFLSQMMRIRWRRWLTDLYLKSEEHTS